MPVITLPVHISFPHWAHQLRIDMPGYRIPVINDINKWRQWASFIVQANKISNVPLPTLICYPDQEDWRQWGARLFWIMLNQKS